VGGFTSSGAGYFSKTIATLSLQGRTHTPHCCPKKRPVSSTSSAPGSRGAPVSSLVPLVSGSAVATSAGFLVLPKAPGRHPCAFARKQRRWMSFLPAVYVYRIKLALSCVLQSITKNIRKVLH